MCVCFSVCGSVSVSLRVARDLVIVSRDLRREVLCPALGGATHIPAYRCDRDCVLCLGLRYLRGADCLKFRIVGSATALVSARQRLGLCSVLCALCSVLCALGSAGV
jgi:hypothetical protein